MEKSKFKCTLYMQHGTWQDFVCISNDCLYVIARYNIVSYLYNLTM